MRPTALRHAMYFGLMLGLLFCINFFLSTRSSAFCSVASWTLMVLIPYIAYRLTLDCRERVCGGRMSYGEAFLYGMQLFFYAALVGAAFRLLYFKYFDPDFLPRTIDESLCLMEQLNMPLGEVETSNLKQMMSPVNMSLNYIWLDVLVGTLVSLVVAAFARKKGSADSDSQIQNQ